MTADGPTPENLNDLLAAVEQTRELVNAVVAGFVSDGFTPEQARQLAVKFLAP